LVVPIVRHHGLSVPACIGFAGRQLQRLPWGERAAEYGSAIITDLHGLGKDCSSPARILIAFGVKNVPQLLTIAGWHPA
ncbi:MAG: hypothetical protein ACK6EB_44785, partial [Planctomyces sp.]